MRSVYAGWAAWSLPPLPSSNHDGGRLSATATSSPKALSTAENRPKPLANRWMGARPTGVAMLDTP